MIVRDCLVSTVVTSDSMQAYGAFTIDLPAGGDWVTGDVTVVAGTPDLSQTIAFFGRFTARNDGGVVAGQFWHDFGSRGIHDDGDDSPTIEIGDVGGAVEIGINSATVGTTTGAGWCFVARLCTGDDGGFTALASDGAVIRRRFGEITTTDSSTWTDVVFDDSGVAEMTIPADTIAAYRIQWTARDANDRSSGLWFVTAKNASGTITIVGDTPSDAQLCTYDNPTTAWDPSTNLRAQTSATGCKLQVKGFSGSSMAWRIRVEQEVRYSPPSSITSPGSGGVWDKSEQIP